MKIVGKPEHFRDPEKCLRLAERIIMEADELSSHRRPRVVSFSRQNLGLNSKLGVRLKAILDCGRKLSSIASGLQPA